MSRCRKKKRKKELGIFFGPKNNAETVRVFLVVKQIYQVGGGLKVEWEDST